MAKVTTKTKAIVLQTIKYGDSSLVVKMLTEESGLQSYMVKGVYGKKSKMKAALFFFFAAWRDACPGTSVAKTVSLWPEDVSEPALGSPRMEGQQVLPGSLAREDRAPTCSMTSPHDSLHIRFFRTGVQDPPQLLGLAGQSLLWNEALAMVALEAICAGAA